MSFNHKQRIASWVGVFAVVGAVVSPVVASAASQSANTTINANVGSTISVSTSTTVNINLTPTPGGVVSSASDTVTVSTNNATGYVLTLADADANTNLVNGANTIAAHAGTQAAPTVLAANTWGYRVDNLPAFGAGPTTAETNNGSSTTIWAGVPATGSPNTIKSNAGVANAEVTTVWYGVKVDSSKPNGTYTDTVTYTATTN